MKVLVTPTSFLKQQNKKAKELLESFADEIVYNPYGRPLESKEVNELLMGCDGYIAGLDYIDKAALNGVSGLKVISRYGAGVDRVDLAAAKEKGIRVTNTPGTNAVAVCELAFGLMLCLARSITVLNKAVKDGEWPRNNGMELKGKKLSILGLGAIGRNLAKRALVFGMDVYAYDPYIDTDYAKANDVKVCSFDEAIRTADFISLHMPLTEKTKHIIGSKAFSKMKKGVYIINTARGGLIDEQAAFMAVNDGKVAGLGLDAYETEPVADSPLLKLDSVISTPHTGAHTNEAISGMGIMSVSNLIAVINKEDCSNVLV